MDLPFDPAIPLLGIYMREPKILIQKNICTTMFIAALFIISKIWKQPKCPSINKWIKQLTYIDTMEYYSTIKKKKFYPLQQHRFSWRTYAKRNKPVRERLAYFTQHYVLQAHPRCLSQFSETGSCPINVYAQVKYYEGGQKQGYYLFLL